MVQIVNETGRLHIRAHAPASQRPKCAGGEGRRAPAANPWMVQPVIQIINFSRTRLDFQNPRICHPRRIKSTGDKREHLVGICRGLHPPRHRDRVHIRPFIPIRRVLKNRQILNIRHGSERLRNASHGRLNDYSNPENQT